MEGFNVILDDRPFEQRRSKAFFMGEPILAVGEGSMLSPDPPKARLSGHRLMKEPLDSSDIVGSTVAGLQQTSARNCQKSDARLQFGAEVTSVNVV